MIATKSGELNHSISRLRKLSPCPEAIEWIESVRDDEATAQSIWELCERGDWMLWICGKLSGPSESDGRKQLVRASCACARLALKCPLACIETAEAWADGKASIDDVRKAAYAAYAAYAAAYAAADAAAYAAADAAYAAAYAAYAAAAAANAARKKMLSACADVVRKFYPKCPL